MANYGDLRWPILETWELQPRLHRPKKIMLSKTPLSMEAPQERHRSPEEHLADAVLAQAVRDAEIIISYADAPARLHDRPHKAISLKNEASSLRKWFASKSTEERSAHWWCNEAGRDPQIYRERTSGAYCEALAAAQISLGAWYYEQKKARAKPVTRKDRP